MMCPEVDLNSGRQRCPLRACPSLTGMSEASAGIAIPLLSAPLGVSRGS